MLIKTNLLDGILKWKDAIENDQSSFFAYCINDREIVNCGNESDVNLLYCRLHDIPVFKLERRNGCMVLNKGDISAIAIRPQNEQLNTLFVKFLVDKLVKCGINATADSNDLIIDGHNKVAGCTKIRLEDGRNVSMIHISINPNPHIKYICLKGRKKMPDGQRKQPAGLSQWGISSWQIEEWLVEFIKINYPEEINNERN